MSEPLRTSDPATLADVERAARFLHLPRLAFGGKIDGVFGVSAGKPRASRSRALSLWSKRRMSGSTAWSSRARAGRS
ncbi:hypothetical protein [Cereibacter changlensis]|uniref:hypothetical protein n=1 Tax=Cereibacter changlensis TaxID=402884 RepID=UPI0040342F70